MNFADIEKGINNLAKKANEGALSIDDMAGGTFTISNGGVYGSLISTPIINPPQVTARLLSEVFFNTFCSMLCVVFWFAISTKCSQRFLGCIPLCNALWLWTATSSQGRWCTSPWHMTTGWSMAERPSSSCAASRMWSKTPGGCCLTFKLRLQHWPANCFVLIWK